MSLFDIGVSGLNSAQWGLTTTGQNISNAATPGYTQEKPVYQEASGQYTTSGYMGSGVNTATVSRSYSDFLTKALNSAQSNSSSLNTYYSMLSQLNNLVGDPTTGIGAGITSYFTSLQSVANNPGTTSTRQSLMSSAQSLANQVNAAATTYNQLRTGVNQQLTSAVTQINSYTNQIATLNGQIASASSQGQPPNQLLDARDQAVANLSQLTSVHVNTVDGAYNVSIGTGQPLVSGTTAYQLQAVTSTSDPSELSIAYASPNGTPLTPATTQYLPDSTFGGGSVGGLLAFRSQSLDPAQAQLGSLATSFAAQMNQQNSLGIDLNGNPGTALFSVGSPTVYSNSRNTGNAQLSVSIANPTQAPSGNYTLSYNGTSYTVTDRASGAALGTLTPTAAGVASGTVAGLNISVASGAMNAGDSFTIEPTSGSLGNFSLATTNPTAIAAASPAVASAGASNAGTANISAATVAAGYSIPSSMTLTYNATTQQMTSNVAVTLPSSTVVPAGTPFAYNPALGLTVSNGTGVSATISGTPASNDTFTIAANTGGTSDGSNALAMANLGSVKSLNGGTDSLTSAYANYVNQIGNETNNLQSSSTSATAVLTQATSAQQSVSGVNLNEEAANLIQYQQLYQANSKVIQTASTLFSTLLGIFN
ncbi:flagellar hook-associated protein FlgK [Caballeronia sp. SEWSISQ10-4 2]|uniref:flagellar hook-associated protein FlgK n=1 Tax=Caballeronia sp. SEWSISQ10-4 2 TaxID=2937438 RepID=UPI002652B534|nr:flagellar hook-associated protein FlgK [Caballeronia sp. SEWSISQ10-4 2]MDN7182036.1 flagellar hook-associated protein FlgK [Caballeronia sp. SEWSISQ10-4 2]